MGSSITNSGRLKTIIISLLSLIIVIGAVAWAVNASNNQSTTSSSSGSNTPDTTNVKSLVSYAVPTGWTDVDCGGGNLIYVGPSGSSGLNCSASSNPDALITLSVKDQINDCSQLQAVQNVKKHICSSTYISGHKTIKSTTEYPSNANEAGKTVSDYYFSTGKTVVRIEYVRHGDSSLQQGFDELARSVKAKS